MLPYLADDIPRLMAVTGLDFGDWLLPRDRSGGLVGDRPAGQAQARNGQPAAPGQAADDSSVRSSCAPSGRASS